MLATLGLLVVTVAVLTAAPLPWWAKLAITLGVQGARVAWLLWQARTQSVGWNDADEQVW